VLRRHLWRRAAWSKPDRVAGSVAGVVAVLGTVWLLTPAFANASGWPARAARGSFVARVLDRWAPEPPGSIAALGRFVGDAPFPEVFERLTSPDAGRPPVGGLDAGVRERIRPAVVKIEGRACDEIQQGSGFVAADDLIVTNAHVVAGERVTTVILTDGRRLAASVVAFDPNRDLAVLRVRGLDVTVPSRADAPVDTPGSVIGYPGGGSQHEAPARVAQQIIARGRDIYGNAPTRRDILVLAAALAPGDSGAPLVDSRGRVIGVAFAVDPSTTTTAYALTRDEVERVLQPALRVGATAPVDTGPCLVG
jgi:S1-C subfamily serine protease